MSGLLDGILDLPALAIVVLVGLLVFAEDALFVGFVVPGETAAILGGVAADLGDVSLTVMCVTVVVASVLGDSVGYHLGARYGPRLSELRMVRRRRDRVEQARRTLSRHGGLAVFLGRFVTFARTFIPFMAGTVNLRYGVFFAYNVAGALVWGVANVLLGYLAGASYRRVEGTLGSVTAVVAAAALVAGVVVWLVHRHRRIARGGDDDEPFRRP